MKLLHTSDWHLGKSLRGTSRLDEQRLVCAEIVEVAAREGVDLVLVVGDVFETGAPAADAQQLAFETLLRLRAVAPAVVVVAGNHDNSHVFEALRPLAAAAGIHVLGRPARPDEGGLLDLVAAGHPVRLVLLPFCSQRSIIRSAELLAGSAADHAGRYAERVAVVLASLMSRFDPGAVNLVAAHVMVRGGRLGGGERDAQTIEDYWVDPTAFGASAHYVALGHLHRTQQVAGGCPIWYSGSPIQVDFGEEGDDKHVLVVEAEPGRPVGPPRAVRLGSARRLRTLTGTLEELAALAGSTGEDLLRVRVRERARAGLAEDVRALLPFAVDVLIDRPEGAGDLPPARPQRARSPHELFAEYLAGEGIADRRVESLFAELLDEELAAGEA